MFTHIHDIRIIYISSPFILTVEWNTVRQMHPLLLRDRHLFMYVEICQESGDAEFGTSYYSRTAKIKEPTLLTYINIYIYFVHLYVTYFLRIYIVDECVK